MGYNNNGDFTAGICVEELRKLTQINGDIHSPFLQRTPSGYLEAITSAFNLKGTTQIPIHIGTKKKTVRITYRQRTIESQVKETEDEVCSPDYFPDFNEEDVDVDKVASISFGLVEDQIALICEGRGEFIIDTLAGQFDALAKNINKNILLDQVINFGVNKRTGLSTATSINVLNGTTGAPLATGIQDLKDDYNVQNQESGLPMVIGGSLINKYFDTLDVGCCNDAGTEMNALLQSAKLMRFLDVDIEGVIGVNNFAVLSPGRTQLVTWNKYVNENAYAVNPLASNGTIKDPRTGILYDMKVLKDECTDQWFIRLELNYGIHFQPLDAYQVDDPLRGINGTYLYTAATT